MLHHSEVTFVFAFWDRTSLCSLIWRPGQPRTHRDLPVSAAIKVLCHHAKLTLKWSKKNLPHSNQAWAYLLRLLLSNNNSFKCKHLNNSFSFKKTQIAHSFHYPFKRSQESSSNCPIPLSASAIPGTNHLGVHRSAIAVVPHHCNKANISTNWVWWHFLFACFSVHIKIPMTLYCSLLCFRYK